MWTLQICLFSYALFPALPFFFQFFLLQLNKKRNSSPSSNLFCLQEKKLIFPSLDNGYLSPVKKKNPTKWINLQKAEIMFELKRKTGEILAFFPSWIFFQFFYRITTFYLQSCHLNLWRQRQHPGSSCSPQILLLQHKKDGFLDSIYLILTKMG